MGGRSRSSTATSNASTEVAFNNVDNRTGEEGNVGGNVNLNAMEGIYARDIITTDLGAIEAGRDIAIQSLSTVESAVVQNATITGKAIASVEELGKVVQTNGESLKVDIQKYAVLGGFLLAAIAIYVVVVKDE